MSPIPYSTTPPKERRGAATCVFSEPAQVFLNARRAKNVSPHTLDYYTQELRLFETFLHARTGVELEKITPNILREYFLDLSKRRNPGGRHASYRAIKAFLRFAWEEYELKSRNPIDRIAPPKRNLQAKPGVEVSDVHRLIATCVGDKLATRDKAIFLALLDTGARAAELCAWTVGDYDPQTGQLVIQSGKGDKRRAVFTSENSRREIDVYLGTRADLAAHAPLFASYQSAHLTVSGLRAIVSRRAALAGVDAPGLHDFRRAFAVNMLRAGVDLESIRRLMGHSDFQVLRRYLDLTTDDLQKAHQRGSPVDRMYRQGASDER